MNLRYFDIKLANITVLNPFSLDIAVKRKE